MSCSLTYNYSETSIKQHLLVLTKCPLNKGYPLNRGLLKIVQCLTINIQWLLCTVIKFHVVKEAKEAVLYLMQDF